MAHRLLMEHFQPITIPDNYVGFDTPYDVRTDNNRNHQDNSPDGSALYIAIVAQEHAYSYPIDTTVSEYDVYLNTTDNEQENTSQNATPLATQNATPLATQNAYNEDLKIPKVVDERLVDRRRKSAEEIVESVDKLVCMVCLSNLPVYTATCCGKSILCKLCYNDYKPKSKCVNCRDKNMFYVFCRDLENLNVDL